MLIGPGLKSGYDVADFCIFCSFLSVLSMSVDMTILDDQGTCLSCKMIEKNVFSQTLNFGNVL